MVASLKKHGPCVLAQGYHAKLYSY
jgi:hypothetical protein